MSFTMLIFIGPILFIVLPGTLGIKMFKKNRLIASLVLLIPIALVLLISTFMYSLFYTTTPEDLNLHILEENEKFSISGKWNKKYEKYAYGKDYIAIFTLDNIEIINTNMETFTIRRIEDRYQFDELKKVIEKNPNYDSTKQLHLFEIKLEEEFSAYFGTTPQVSREDLIIQYIHVYYPPMDPFQYWVKTVDGLVSDPLNMYR